MKPADPSLEALWKHVLDRWDDDASHRAFLDYCQSQDVLAEAAVRYRGMKGDRDRGAIAEKRLSAVAMLAMSKLEVSRAEPKASSALTKLLLIFFFMAGSLLVLAYLLRT